MRSLTLALLLAATLAAPAPARAGPAPPSATPVTPVLAFKTRTLANGLKLITLPDRSTSNVSVQVWYGVGGKDDPQGRSGFAHLFEHMMFKATRDMPSEFFDRLTEDVGGENNAFTAEDVTAFYETIPANHLERLIWAEGQRLGALVVDLANFTSEREVVKEELRQRVEADPYGKLGAILIPDASYAVHPYKRPVIGSIADLDAATLSEVRAFHATYYRPDNAHLIVAGNFDAAQLDGWVDRYLGALLRPTGPIPRVTAVEPPRSAARTVVGYGANVALPAVALTYPVPPAAHPDAAALQVADAILSTGKSSRLYRELVYTRQLATSVESQADLRQQPGLFVAQAVLAGGKTLAEAETALKGEIKRLRDAEPTAAELARAKVQLLARSLEGRETVQGRAFELGNAAVIEGDPARADRDLAAVQAVTAADVRRVAEAYLTEPRSVTIRYLDQAARPKGAPPEPASPPSPAVAAATPSAPVVAPQSAARASPPPPAAPVRARAAQPVQRVLANGLTIVVARTGDLPLVTANLTVRHGAADDPERLAGAAGLTAALLTQGTATRSATQIADEIEALGGTLTSSAGWDQSGASLTVPTAQLSGALPILADVVRRPAFAAAELERLRRQKLDALAVTLSEPGGIAGLAVWPAVQGGASSYGHASGGTPASLARFGRQDAVAFHAAHYRPRDAVLVITGGIAPEAAFALAERAFGDWAGAAAPAEAVVEMFKPPLTGRGGPRVIAIDLPGAGQAAVTVATRSISRSDPAYVATRVANSVLGGGFSARLNADLRVRRGLSYGAFSGVSALADAGLFRASAQTKNASAAEVAGLMLDLVKAVAAQPIGPEELGARKAALVGQYGRETERSAGLAELLAAAAVYRRPLTEVADYPDRVQAVGAEQARAAALAALDAGQATVIVVGDAKVFLPALQARFPNVERIAAADLDLDNPTLRRAPR